MSAPIHLQHKAAGFAIAYKENLASNGGDWVIAGYASTFGGPPDLVGDVIETGAYRESLRARPSVPLLWQHDQHEPIGKTILLKEDQNGLLFKARLVPTRRGGDAQVLVKNQVITSTSIGYDAESRPGNTPDEKRRLHKISLYEISLVTWAANPKATLFAASGPAIQAVKDALLVAELETSGIQIQYLSRREQKAYFAAQERQLERAVYNGKTARQCLYDVCFQLQELQKVR